VVLWCVWLCSDLDESVLILALEAYSRWLGECDCVCVC